MGPKAKAVKPLSEADAGKWRLNKAEMQKVAFQHVPCMEGGNQG